MSDGYNFKVLQREIFKLSSSSDWEIAKNEWFLVDVEKSGTFQTCLCGHFPIIEICTIKNRITGNVTTVGNSCVKRFLGYRSDLIFAAIKRIKDNIEKSLNPAAIAFFHSIDIINSKDLSFLENTARKKQLSIAQMAWRTDINKKILLFVENKGLKSTDAK